MARDTPIPSALVALQHVWGAWRSKGWGSWMSHWAPHILAASWYHVPHLPHVPHVPCHGSWVWCRGCVVAPFDLAWCLGSGMSGTEQKVKRVLARASKKPWLWCLLLLMLFCIFSSFPFFPSFFLSFFFPFPSFAILSPLFFADHPDFRAQSIRLTGEEAKLVSHHTAGARYTLTTGTPYCFEVWHHQKKGWIIHQDGQRIVEHVLWWSLMLSVSMSEVLGFYLVKDRCPRFCDLANF